MSYTLLKKWIFMIWKTQNYIPFFPTESQFSIKVSNIIFSKKKYLMGSFKQTL